MIKKIIFIFGLIFCVLVIMYYFYLVNNRVQYPRISDTAQIINYYDITEDNKGNRIEKGVQITYISGHSSSDMHVAFDNYRPYKRLEMYEDEGVFNIIYDEEDTGESKDRLFAIKGEVGYQIARNGNIEYNVEVYRNGKRVKDVFISSAQE